MYKRQPISGTNTELGKTATVTFEGTTSPTTEDVYKRQEKLINERDGLALGICNGFQALIKLGLVPYGELRQQDAQSPTPVSYTHLDVYKRQDSY